MKSTTSLACATLTVLTHASLSSPWTGDGSQLPLSVDFSLSASRAKLLYPEVMKWVPQISYNNIIIILMKSCTEGSGFYQQEGQSTWAGGNQATSKEGGYCLFFQHH